MKKAIIIGGTSGIGRALAEKLVDNGWKVGITGRRTELLAEIKEQSPEQIVIQKHDVTAVDSSDQTLELLFQELKSVDMVIVSSAAYELNPSLDWEIDQKMIETNVLGITKVYQFVFSKLKAQGFGHLVGISSISAIRGSRFCPSYSASKAFQANYLEAIRCISKKEKLNITVTDVQPGYVDTVMAESDIAFWVTPLPKATNQIYKGILKQKRKLYISKRWRLIAWSMKIAPSWLLERLY